jgi:hypothetical protein
MLLERTIASILRQRGFGRQRMHVIVVGHDRPEVEVLDDGRVTWMTSDYQICAETQGQFLFDRLVKCHIGLLCAADLNPSHVMLCDADDLLHVRLLECIESMPEYDVYSIARGYGYSVRRNCLFRINDFHRVCASAHVFRVGRIKLPASRSRCEELTCLPLVGHNAVCDEALRRGLRVGYIPMRAAIYVVDHGSNLCADAGKTVGAWVQWRHSLKIALRWAFLTERVRSEFGLSREPLP